MEKCMPKKETGFRGTSLKADLMTSIERFITDNPDAGYKSVSDFVQEAVRIRMQEIRKLPPLLPRFEHFNLSDNGVRILDRTLKPKRIADIYFRPEGIWCDLCKAHSCEHIDFALNEPEIKQLTEKKRREGWKLPEV